MQNKQLPPFNRGDEVIDDNAEIGYVLENYIDATWDAAGNITNWHTRIHYRWDQPSYGLTRVVSEGEISLLTPRAPDDCPRGGSHVYKWDGTLPTEEMIECEKCGHRR